MLFHRFLQASAAAPDGLQFVGGAAFNNSATATPSCSLTGLSGGLASAPAIDDFAIAVIACNYGADIDVTCTTSGWTELREMYSNDSNDINFGIYYKRLTTAETSVAFTLSGISMASQFAVHVWRGVNITPLDGSTNGAAGANSGVPNPGSISTVTDGAVVIAIGGAASEVAYPLSDLTVPSGMENFFQANTSSSSALGIASAVVPTAGAYDPAPFGGGNTSIRSSWATVTFSLRPA